VFFFTPTHLHVHIVYEKLIIVFYVYYIRLNIFIAFLMNIKIYFFIDKKNRIEETRTIFSTYSYSFVHSSARQLMH
jgi:hypothetical protein